MTGRPLRISDAMVESFMRLKASGLTVAKIGQALKDEYPETWPDSFPKSVYAFMDNFVREGRGTVPEPHKAFPSEMPEVQIDFDPKVIVVSDLHAPLHDVDLIHKACAVISSRGYETMIWNGDTFDNAHRGHKNVRNVRAAPFGMGLHAVGAIMDAFTAAGIRRHVLLPGNHDDKIWRDADQEFGFGELLHAKLWPILEQRCEWVVSLRYYVVMRPREPRGQWPFRSENFPWRFTHQKNYRGKQLSTADALCGIYMSHVVTGHQHHLAMGQHGSGVLWACDAGTFQNPDLVEYKQARDSAHVAWHPGFLTIDQGTPMMWSTKAPKEWWDAQTS